MVKRALFAIATHSNLDDLTPAERKFAASFENAFQANFDHSENDSASNNKALARHRRWKWFNGVVNTVGGAVGGAVNAVGGAVSGAVNAVSGTVRDVLNAINRIRGIKGILKAFSKIGARILDAAGLNFGQDFRDIKVSCFDVKIGRIKPSSSKWKPPSWSLQLI